MIDIDIEDASRRLAEVGYSPAWLPHPAGGYLNATRAGSCINVRRFDYVEVKLMTGDGFTAPPVALIASSLDEALAFVAIHDPMDYMSPGYLAAVDFEMTVLDRLREEDDITSITPYAATGNFHLTHIRKTPGFYFSVDTYRFDKEGNRL